jgi:hypothetical protein
MECIKNATDNGKPRPSNSMPLSTSFDFTDQSKWPGDFAEAKFSTHSLAGFSWNRAESLCQTGRSSRFLNGVVNPTTAPQGPKSALRATEVRQCELLTFISDASELK